MIYLDSAATSFHKPECVAKAVYDAMHQIGSDGRGAHEMTLRASRIVSKCRQSIADTFGANPLRVCFTQNATAALNIAICGLIEDSDHVITTTQEHNSVLRPLYKTGAELTILPIDENGVVQLDLLKSSLHKNTKAVVCSHVSNVTGNVLDIAKIGEFCKENNLIFILDAAQSAGVFEINMKKMGISVLCFTGHKSLLGPQGTGGLCIADKIEIKPFMVGGSGIHSFDNEHPLDYPTRLEAGTLNAHSLAGLLAGVEWIKCEGIENLRKKENELVFRLYNGIKDINGVKIYGDFSKKDRGGILSMNIGDEDASLVSDALSEDFGICTRAGAHCAPLIHKAMGTKEQGMVRFSFSYANTIYEVDTVINAIKSLTGN